MKGKRDIYRTALTATLLPLTALLILWITRPFPELLSSNSASVSALGPAQKANIGLASAKIDRLVLRPGERFSFNNRVGRRTVDRGFRAAPTYENGKTIKTEGGGVCLLSSLLYKSALEAGLGIIERQPHSRPISSMPPGLDATVTFGKFDLVFENTTAAPILIECAYAADNGAKVDVHIRGKIGAAGEEKPAKVFSGPLERSGDQLKVSIYRKQAGRTSLVSSDTYKL